MVKEILKREQEERARLLHYRDRALSRRLLERVLQRGEEVREKVGRRPTFMEVCGTHTMSFSRTGLRRALGGVLELRSGPGCPVCVTSYKDIDRVIALGEVQGVTLATFGDMVRVPGSYSSLEQQKARGYRVKVFYSPSEAVQWAHRNPDQQVIFIGVGFETTAPVTALSIQEAEENGIKNYSVLSLHKLVPPALRALLGEEGLGVDGLILPGHVAAVTGRQAFDFLSLHRVPAVVAGFEPVDLLGALDNLLGQLSVGDCRVDNNYTRVVREGGNQAAQRVIREFYQVEKAEWRGLGRIPGSGLALKKELAPFDASHRFPIQVPEPQVPGGCRCGEILRGLIVPDQCRLFGRECLPGQPVGACMVSSEGACAAYYQYGLREQE